MGEWTKGEEYTRCEFRLILGTWYLVTLSLIIDGRHQYAGLHPQVVLDVDRRGGGEPMTMAIESFYAIFDSRGTLAFD